MKVQEGPEEKKLYRKWNIFFCTVAQNRNVYTLKVHLPSSSMCPLD